MKINLTIEVNENPYLDESDIKEAVITDLHIQVKDGLMRFMKYKLSHALQDCIKNLLTESEEEIRSKVREKLDDTIYESDLSEPLRRAMQNIIEEIFER